MYVLQNVCFYEMLFHLFVVKFILVNPYFFFCAMVTILMKEVKIVVVVDDLDFGIKDIAFEAKVFNRFDTFD